MLKFFSDLLSDYQHAGIIQTAILFGFVIFFAGLIYSVMKKPKSYYKETSELPLEDEDPLI